MNEEKIIDAMEYIDDRFIEDVYTLKTTPKKHKIVWLKYVGIAACIVLVVGLFAQGYYYGPKSDSNNSSFAGSSTNGTTESVNEKEDIAFDVSDEITTYVSSNESSGSTSGSTGEFLAGSSPNNSSVYGDSPAYVEIVEITNDGFVVKFSSSENLVNAVYGENFKLEEKAFKVGDKVYITYGINSSDSSKIYIHSISYREG